MSNKIYAKVQAALIDGLKNGIVPWERPWRVEPHHNPVTGHIYSGINVLELELAAQKNFLASGRWLTFKQIKKAGLHLRKGAKGAIVTFFTLKEVKDKDDEEKSRKIPMVRYYHVFNVQDIEGTGVEKYQPDPEATINFDDSFSQAEEFITGLKENAGLVVKDARKAFYSASQDSVGMPPKGLFTATSRGGNALEGYYATILHELVHWSGAKHRLDRGFFAGMGKGDREYACEELVAEIGASFLAARLGLPYRSQHADYIGSWLAWADNDTRYFYKAAKEAQKASDWLIEQSGIEAEEVRHAA